MEYLIIQVEEKRVTAARFGLSGRSATLAGAASFPLSEEQGLPEVAAQIGAGVTGSPRVVLCLEAALFAQRSVELPLTDLRKVREVLPAHLQGETVLPVEEAVFDAIPIAGGRYLALWAKRADIAHAISVFKEAGIEPQIVTAAPFAWGFLPGVGIDCAVSDGCALGLIAGGSLSFIRSIKGPEPVGQLGSTLTALELSGIALPPRLFVFGEQAGELALAEELPLRAEQLELPGDLAMIFKNDDTFQQLAGLFAVARASHSGALPDFRRGDLAWTAGDVKLRKKLALTASLATVTVLLLFVSEGLKYRAARDDLASLNKSIAAIYREIFPTRSKAVDELSEVKGEIRKLAGAAASGNFLDVLKKMAEAKGNTINGLYEAELDGSTLRVKGDARSAQAVNEFKLALTPLMSTIELGEVKSRPDGTATFSLTGTVKEVKK